jgi:hypothetical protein
VVLLPTVTYIGNLYMRPNADTSMGDWIRGQVVEVTQDWLDANKRQLKPTLFVIEGAAYDLLNDGIPDSGWVKADIASWLRDKGMEVSNGYKTKSSLLAMVEDVLSPAPVEEVIVEAAPEIVEEIVVEETPVEEAIEEAVETEITEE